jgi:hypothetical protein
MGVDLIAALYRGLTSYAAIQQANGHLPTANDYRKKAAAYQDRIDADWWDQAASQYYTHYTNAHQFGKAEGETFLLWFDVLKDTARKGSTIRHLQSMDLNVENLSYLPLQYYRNGYWDQAYDLIMHLVNPSTQRREYPEVSYGVIEAMVQGLMGVDADASTHTVSTLYRPGKTNRPGNANRPASAAPNESAVSNPPVSSAQPTKSIPGGTILPAGSSKLTDLPILNTTVTITHFSRTQSSISNTGQHPILWKARFTGNYDKATVTSRKPGKNAVRGKPAGTSTTRMLKKGTGQQGQTISWLEMPVAPGQELTVRVR